MYLMYEEFVYKVRDYHDDQGAMMVLDVDQIVLERACPWMRSDLIQAAFFR